LEVEASSRLPVHGAKATAAFAGAPSRRGGAASDSKAEALEIREDSEASWQRLLELQGKWAAEGVQEYDGTARPIHEKQNGVLGTTAFIEIEAADSAEEEVARGTGDDTVENEAMDENSVVRDSNEVAVNFDEAATEEAADAKGGAQLPTNGKTNGSVADAVGSFTGPRPKWGQVPAKSSCGNASKAKPKDYMVDNRQLKAKTSGLSYCCSKQPGDAVAGATALWGTTVSGIDEGDGWLAVTRRGCDRFLPFTLGGVPVLSLNVPVPSFARATAVKSAAARGQGPSSPMPAVRQAKTATWKPAARLSTPVSKAVTGVPSAAPKPTSSLRGPQQSAAAPSCKPAASADHAGAAGRAGQQLARTYSGQRYYSLASPGTGGLEGSPSSRGLQAGPRPTSSKPAGKQPAAPQQGLKRPGSASLEHAKQDVKRVKQAEGTAAASDPDGRDYDLKHIVVNFANVGASYAMTVLGKDPECGDKVFDWEGVRRCVRYLRFQLGMQVIGVVFEHFWGSDRGGPKRELPVDIKTMCASVEETPRLTGRNQKSADNEMSIKCAWRRNCRFLENDSNEWLTEIRNEKCRVWLEKTQEALRMQYCFDGLGNFTTLDA